MLGEKILTILITVNIYYPNIQKVLEEKPNFKKKLAKDINKQFTKEEIQVANKHKICTTTNN